MSSLQVQMCTFASKELRTFELFVSEYPNGRPAIHLVDQETQEPYGVITVNVVDHEPQPGCVFVSLWDINQWKLEFLNFEEPLFEPTGREVPCGYTSAVEWRLTDRFFDQFPELQKASAA